MIEIHVTDKSNQNVAPPKDYPMLRVYKSIGYDIPGYDYNSDEIILPDISPVMSVEVGEEFRVWYGQDLINGHEENNSGKTCADVYLYYTLLYL